LALASLEEGLCRPAVSRRDDIETGASWLDVDRAENQDNDEECKPLHAAMETTRTSKRRREWRSRGARPDEGEGITLP
jgi:hypothetical protein